MQTVTTELRKNVRDHIPLEQGLRHYTYGDDSTFDQIVRDHIPLEQGLRQLYMSLLNACCRVRDHIPLEQGLRQDTSFHS